MFYSPPLHSERHYLKKGTEASADGQPGSPLAKRAEPAPAAAAGGGGVVAGLGGKEGEADITSPAATRRLVGWLNFSGGGRRGRGQGRGMGRREGPLP